jgi:transposase
MNSGVDTAALTPAEAAVLRAERDRLAEQVQALQRQLDWFKRQLFGEKSERRLIEPSPDQLSLGEGLAPTPEEAAGAAVPVHEVAAHTRRQAHAKPTEDNAGEAELFFDASVPVEVIELPALGSEGAPGEEFEIIGEKVSYRLAQHPASYVILKYVRPVLKCRAEATIHCAPAPAGVLGTSRADVSFIAGLVLDKFAYHLPLYRQHQRLEQAGIHVSRAWLTGLVHSAAALLEPVHRAQLDSIRASRVIAMDETPIKAGRKGKGKLKTGYFWPVYGEADEVSFLYYPSRGQQHVVEALGRSPPEGTVLVSDGYSAYARYAETTGLTHAQCWAHTRRKFVQAEPVEPEAAATALELIGALYAIEAEIRDQTLAGNAKRLYRLEHAKPVVERFFAWAEQRLAAHALLPTNPLTKALGYALERRAGLEVYLSDPDVPIDTNHLERALRPIPMGRKAWLFCWSEVGAKAVGILQSLITTCRLHDVHPYAYLVDVLQRIDRHPASKVELLTPRLWKQHFADAPLRSPLHSCPP